MVIYGNISNQLCRFKVTLTKQMIFNEKLERKHDIIIVLVKYNVKKH